MLREPDLARVHAPGHGDDRARDPGGAEPQQARYRGVASTGCDGGEHPYSGDAVGWRVMTLFKHKIEWTPIQEPEFVSAFEPASACGGPRDVLRGDADRHPDN